MRSLFRDVWFLCARRCFETSARFRNKRGCTSVHHNHHHHHDHDQHHHHDHDQHHHEHHQHHHHQHHHHHHQHHHRFITTICRMCHSILAAAKMLLLAKPCVSAQAPRLRRSRLRRGCNFESAPKQVKTTFIHLLPFACSRCTAQQHNWWLWRHTPSYSFFISRCTHTHTEQTQHTHTAHSPN